MGRHTINPIPVSMIEIFTIYESPSDHPGRFVLRRWHTHFGGQGIYFDKEPIAVVDQLEEARKNVPSGCHRLDRSPEDDPVIVETWIR